MSRFIPKPASQRDAISVSISGQRFDVKLDGCRVSLVSEPETDLIEAIRDGLPPGVEFDEREETLLSLAARQARDVVDSPGQPR